MEKYQKWKEMESYVGLKARNKIRRTHYVNLNKLVWKYFEDCRESGIKLNGKMLKEQAMRYANVLGLESFRGSEGWLDAFKRRHKIDLRTMTGDPVCYENDLINGESMDMSSTMIENINQQVDLIDKQNQSHLNLNLSIPSLNSTSTSQLPQNSNFISEEMTASQFLEAFGNAALTADLNEPVHNNFMPNNLPIRKEEDFKMPHEKFSNENSTISNIVRSCALRVPSPEVTFALDTIRSFILANDPSAMDSLVQLQQKIVEIDKMKSSSSSSSTIE
ncbi:unnamed protein product [Caenorhabditis angaria]|uniref:HTH CENPB-type domain-containing protein n=1 Tax=Caenorhabditis angaria TaxID=860376 RepID=A0A9P1N1F5_9PELO|nr:unnamed protein product [Caenorhabditis angaria]